MLDGDAAMRPLVLHGRDDAGLAVAPFDGADTGGAPQWRVLPVGGGDQGPAQGTAGSTPLRPPPAMVSSASSAMRFQLPVPGLVPGTHVVACRAIVKTWMPGTSPGKGVGAGMCSVRWTEWRAGHKFQAGTPAREKTPMAHTITPLTEHTGAEIRGLDLT